MKTSTDNHVILRCRPTLVLLALLASVFNPSVAQAQLAEGLVEYWSLDGDFTAGIDKTHEGTLEAKGAGLAESGFVAGKFGMGIDLESSDASNQASVIIGGNEEDFDFAEGSMTVSIWYTTESLYRAWQTLVGKGENNNWRLARNSTSATQLKMYLTIIGDGELDQQDGSWHLAVASVDAIDGNKLWVDGNLVASNAGPSTLSNSPEPMQIGGNPQAADRGWDGIIDDVGIWSRALTEEEVAALWNDGNGASIASLIGATGEAFTITAVDYSPGDQMITLTWPSREGEVFAVKYSRSMDNWGADLDDGVEAEVGSESTTRTFSLAAAGLDGAQRMYFRVEKSEG